MQIPIKTFIYSFSEGDKIRPKIGIGSTIKDARNLEEKDIV